MTKSNEFLNRRVFNPGQIIFHEGEDSYNAFLVQSGRVKLATKISGGLELCEIVETNAIFGEMALVDGGPRLMTATAIEQVTAVVIPKENFDEKFEQADPIIRSILDITLMFIRNIYALHDSQAVSLPELLKSLSPLTKTVCTLLKTANLETYPSDVSRDLTELEAIIYRLNQYAAQVSNKTSSSQ